MVAVMAAKTTQAVHVSSLVRVVLPTHLHDRVTVAIVTVLQYHNDPFKLSLLRSGKVRIVLLIELQDGVPDAGFGRFPRTVVAPQCLDCCALNVREQGIYHLHTQKYIQYPVRRVKFVSNSVVAVDAVHNSVLFRRRFFARSIAVFSTVNSGLTVEADSTDPGNGLTLRIGRSIIDLPCNCIVPVHYRRLIIWNCHCSNLEQQTNFPFSVFRIREIILSGLEVFRECKPGTMTGLANIL